MFGLVLGLYESADLITNTSVPLDASNLSQTLNNTMVCDRHISLDMNDRVMNVRFSNEMSSRNSVHSVGTYRIANHGLHTTSSRGQTPNLFSSVGVHKEDGSHAGRDSCRRCIHRGPSIEVL